MNDYEQAYPHTSKITVREIVRLVNATDVPTERKDSMIDVLAKRCENNRRYDRYKRFPKKIEDKYFSKKIYKPSYKELFSPNLRGCEFDDAVIINLIEDLYKYFGEKGEQKQ